MPGMVWKSSASSRRVARHDGERDLGPDAGDREQLLEELAFLRAGEAEELHRVLTDVEVGLDGDLLCAVCLLYRRGRGEHAVPDAVHVEDEALGVAGDGLPAEARDHRRPPAAAMSGGASAWQIATASASAAWCGLGISVRPSTERTIRCIWSFSARP